LTPMTLFERLQEDHPCEYPDSKLRTFQRRVSEWKALYGPEKDVMFRQKQVVGRMGLSDFTKLKIEESEEFIQARRKHSAVESSINDLENHGLDCLDHGIDDFKRYVALAVVARNIQIIGHILQQKEIKRLKR
ncbi:MAG: hypothetical protein U9N19_10255, partial [Thermodesulfobacteriota bacterium]|nr:hypothetical protein [Thermodesulfobacteriota bacterium]